MPDRISTTAFTRTDSGTRYASLAPDQLDSTVGVTGPRVPIGTTPPEVDGDIQRDPIPPLEVHADVEALEEILTDAAESIAEASSLKASAALSGRTAEWVTERGFDELDAVSAETLVSRQAALIVLLRATSSTRVRMARYPRRTRRKRSARRRRTTIQCLGACSMTSRGSPTPRTSNR